jgi:hypothetical protein
MKELRCLLIAATLSSSTMGWSATDPFAGKWTLNVEKSKYPPGACPKGMVIEMETRGGGVHYSSEAILANGSSTRSEYTADYDGKPVIVVGTHGILLPVSLKRIAPNTVVASYTKGLQVVATSRRVVSNDGRVMTVTTVSRDRTGKTVTNIGVYERQK